MKNCEICSDQNYSEYLDGELSAEERRAFEAKVANCLVCQERLAQMKIVRKHFGQLRSIKASPDFVTVLRARIQMSKNIGQRSWWPFDGRIPLRAAAFSLATLVVVIWFMSRDSWNDPLFTRPETKTTSGSNITPLKFRQGNANFLIDFVHPPRRISQTEHPASDQPAFETEASSIERAAEDSVSLPPKKVPKKNKHRYFPVSF